MLHLLLLAACVRTPPGAEPPPDAPAATVSREAFNQAAVELALPLFERPTGEVVTYRSRLPFDGDLDAATARVREAAGAPGALDARHEGLRAELRAGRLTLIETPVDRIPASDAAMVRELLAVADRVEDLYQRQRGVAAVRSAIPADDPLALAVFERNQGPWCESPAQADDPDCRVLDAPSPRLSGIYPDSAQQGEDWCSRIPREAMDPFHVAVAGPDGLVAEPYSAHWSEAMVAVAEGLERAAAAAPDDEAALAAYLRAAANGFRTNDWFAADAAWAAMDQDNSRWYLRVGPDETYWDPCSEHAGFHFSLALVSQEGKRYQALLSPVKQDMERHLAALAGPPYAEREVGFDLPEFIEVVLNAGDSRSALGATVGQSLPNWGPVAEAGGRTVAMTNVGIDPDSVASHERALSALFCTDTLAAWPRDPEPLLFSTVLHEAAHNLGPAQEYRVEGKTDSELFGGPLASMLEELKAQTAALELTIWLAKAGRVADEEVTREQVADLAWALGKIADGMVDGAGHPQAYSQLSAIQVGFLLERGGLAWHPDRPAANGTDTGCFEHDRAAMSEGIGQLAREVFRIKGAGDRAAAEALRDAYVADGTDFAGLREIVTERMGREPANSYVYRVELPATP